MATGIIILSLNLGVENNSIIVAIIVAIIKSNIDVDVKMYIIINVVIKNAILPSKDFLKNLVVPYLIPMRAAAASEKLITKRATIATFSIKKYMVIAEPTNTHDAPDNSCNSCGRVTVPNRLIDA